MTKRTASELWDALDEATVDSELESLSAKTPEEHRRDLADAGYDLDKVHAEADAFFASMPKAASATPAPDAVLAATTAPATSAPAAPAATRPGTSTPPPPAVSVLRPRRMRPAVVVPIALALAAAVALVIRAA